MPKKAYKGADEKSKLYYFRNEETFKKLLKAMFQKIQDTGLSDIEIENRLGIEYLKWCQSCPLFERTFCIRTEMIIRLCFEQGEQDCIIEIREGVND